MSLDKALGFVMDISKFIQTLWAAYIGLIGVMIGWMISLHTKPSPIDSSTGKTLIVAFVLASIVFAVVLHQNHLRLIRLMHLVDEIAPIEGRKLEHPEGIYRSVFRTGSTAFFLHGTTCFVAVIAVLVSIFIRHMAQ